MILRDSLGTEYPEQLARLNAHGVYSIYHDLPLRRDLTDRMFVPQS